ncbi:hypothetical protein UlMin_026674, partial [Ulmus minor]
MATHRKANLALDAFRNFSSKVLTKPPIPHPSSRIIQIQSSNLRPNRANFYGFSSFSTISSKSISKFRQARTHYNPFLTGAKRYYQVQHFRPRGSRRWFQNPRDVLIMVAGVFPVVILIYFDNLETIPYTKRTHFVLVSKSVDKKLGESRFNMTKAAFKGNILPASHPQSVRVRLIANEIVQALQRGLGHEPVWSDVGYASESYGEEERFIITVGEMFEDKWFTKVLQTRKKGQERGSQSPISHLDGLNWEVLVVGSPTIYAFCLPGGKIVVCSGLLDHCGTDTEIATMIGHEVGHIVARHAAEGLTKDLWFSIVEYFIPDTMWPPFVRRMEVEADHIGLLLMASAGYDPRLAPKVYEKLDKLPCESASRDYLSMHPSTHPSGKERAQLLARAQ